jgi:hypothetical protein
VISKLRFLVMVSGPRAVFIVAIAETACLSSFGRFDFGSAFAKENTSMNNIRCANRPPEHSVTVDFCAASVPCRLWSRLTCSTRMCASEMRDVGKSEKECTQIMNVTPLACRFHVISSRNLFSMAAWCLLFLNYSVVSNRVFFVR